MLASAETLLTNLNPYFPGTSCSEAICVLLQIIKKQMEEGVSQRRVGFVSKGAPARQHSEIQTPDGQKVR